jgi:hypothetical protein
MIAKHWHQKQSQSQLSSLGESPEELLLKPFL